ncbi:MAG: MFS transporter, partial [Rhodospirillales bacterium]|nr:MFS transporter [Rhodospirillales bacterium]
SLLLLIGVGVLMIALVQGLSLERPVLLGAVLLGGCAFALLLRHERRIAEPMLPLELWRSRVIAVGSLGNGFAGAVMMGVSAFLPTYVQGAMGRSPVAGGLVLGAMSVSWAAASFAGGRLMMRTSYRLAAMVGGSCLVIGAGMLAVMTPANGPLWAGTGSLVIGIGMGCCSTVFIVSVQASVPWRQRGAATSSTMFMRFIGQSIGAAACGAVLNASIAAIDPSASNAVDRLLDVTGRALMTATERAHLTDVVARSLHHAYLLATLFAVVTLLIASRMPPRLSPQHQVPDAPPR